MVQLKAQMFPLMLDALLTNQWLTQIILKTDPHALEKNVFIYMK